MRLNLPLFLLLSALLGSTAAWADDYTDISQLIRAGKLTEAQTRVDKAISEHPKDVQYRFLKGVVQREAGRTHEAIATFTKLTEDHPELPEPYNNLAVIYASQNQWDKARSALEMALRTNPSYATAHENLADVYAKLASQAYSKALQMDDKAVASPAKLALIGEVHAPGTGAKAVAQASKSTAAPSPATPAPAVVAQTAPAAPAKPVDVPVAASASKAPPPAAGPSAASATVAPQSVAPAVASVAKPSPEPAAASTVAADHKSNGKDVEAAVNAWARAWASKNMNAYLSAYGPDFKPASLQSRSAWEQDRRLKITSKNAISVKLNGLTVTVNGDRAVAKFHQEYKADALSVTSRKTLELSKVSGRWLISKEFTGS